MTTHELTREQLVELKETYLTETMDEVSQGELADADSLVSDETIHEKYAGTNFVPDDFWCSAGKEQ